MMKRQSICLAVLILFFVSNIGYAAIVGFQGLGDLPGGIYDSKAYGISADGSVVVGTSISASGGEAFHWTQENGMVGLGDLPGSPFESYARGVSNNGSVIVGFGWSTLGMQAFRWEDLNGNGQVDVDEKLDNHPEFGIGDLTDEIFPTLAYDVSYDGSVVVGRAFSSSGFAAFRWTEADGVKNLGDLDGGRFESHAYGVSADGLVVVGTSVSGLGYEAFCWEDNVMTGLGYLTSGYFYSAAHDVSSDRSVLVGHAGGVLGTEPVRWVTTGEIEGLGNLPGAFGSIAYSVSANGLVVVGGDPEADNPGAQAFIWDRENGIQSLKDVLEVDYGLNLAGWTLYVATGISDDGLTIVGCGINPDGYKEGWIATIPEPATLLLLSLGAAMLRRKLFK